MAAQGNSRLRLDPHAYGGTRGSEPQGQMLVQLVQRWEQIRSEYPWLISLHLEAETVGRRDLSLDLDRAWIGVPLSSADSSPYLVFGRIHPWDLSWHPESSRPWGLLAQSQSQNRGILLGYGYSGENDAPQPILLGWLGVHLWSDRSHESAFQWGASFTPFFIPSMGSEVSFSSKDPTTVGRFGRRPPGFVNIENSIFPLRYEIDRSRIFDEVILQAQAMAQAQWKLSSLVSGLEGWFTLSHAPQPDPSSDASGFLNVSGSGIEAVAVVRPKFPQRWLGSLTHQWSPPQAPLGFSVLSSVQAGEDKRWGIEWGVDTRYGGVSVVTESLWGTPPEFNPPRYADFLVQADGRIPVSLLTFFAGIKTHPKQKDLWLSSGVHTAVASQGTLVLGVDLFSGDENSYFGEWRTNDRVYLAFNWQIGS